MNMWNQDDPQTVFNLIDKKINQMKVLTADSQMKKHKTMTHLSKKVDMTFLKQLPLGIVEEESRTYRQSSFMTETLMNESVMMEAIDGENKLNRKSHIAHQIPNIMIPKMRQTNPEQTLKQDNYDCFRAAVGLLEDKTNTMEMKNINENNHNEREKQDLRSIKIIRVISNLTKNSPQHIVLKGKLTRRADRFHCTPSQKMQNLPHTDKNKITSKSKCKINRQGIRVYSAQHTPEKNCDGLMRNKSRDIIGMNSLLINRIGHNSHLKLQICNNLKPCSSLELKHNPHQNFISLI